MMPRFTTRRTHNFPASIYILGLSSIMSPVEKMDKSTGSEVAWKAPQTLPWRPLKRAGSRTRQPRPIRRFSAYGLAIHLDV